LIRKKKDNGEDWFQPGFDQEEKDLNEDY